MEENSETRSVSLRQFITARTQELVGISSRVAENSAEKAYTPFKHIPKNLRRRAVSHNIKRLPGRFRPKVTEATKKNPLSFISSKKVKKLGSRKHRRRKSSLLLEYNRRQREYKWMETHIWHAKRFHIESKWNYKIPVAPCDKGRRALYRSTKSYATMQDISFASAFQLTGDFECICAGFREIAPKPCNTLSLGAVMFSSGEREGRLRVYRKDSYPFGYIGEIQFQWLKQKQGEKSVLWLWIHPAYREEIISQLLLVFDLNVVFPLSTSKEKVDAQESMTIDEVKLLPKHLNEKKTWSSATETLVLTDLEGELNRFRFCGPETFSVFKEVLRPSQSRKYKKSCLDKFLEDPKMLQKQELLWSLLEKIEDFPAHSILPLVVRDPRVFLPKARAKILVNNEADSESDDDVPDTHSETYGENGATEDKMEVDGRKDSLNAVEDPSISEVLSKYIANSASNPLEDTFIRLSLVKEKMTDQEFCKRRAGLLIPGTEIDLAEEENQVPVLIIHRPPTSNSKSFSDGGFDLIVPAGWAMAFWIAFAYRATRVTGLRDSISCAFETSNLHSPNFLPPDSDSGAKEGAHVGESRRSKYFNLTPAKRPNLIKLGCCSPFTPDWAGILSFWSQEEETPISSYYILRDSARLNLLADNVKTKFWRKLVENLESIERLDQCLIGVRVELTGKGKPEEGAIISLPEASDLTPLPAATSESSSVHTEPLQDDSSNHKKRSEFQKKHQKVMGFLRTKRKKLRKSGKASADDDDPLLSRNREELLSHYNSQPLSLLYNQQMNNLWLISPDQAQDTYRNLSRKPMGFIFYGGNGYSHGKCSGIGFVSAGALLQFAKNAVGNKKLGQLVLLRNWESSDIYRPGKLQILRL